MRIARPMRQFNFRQCGPISLFMCLLVLAALQGCAVIAVADTVGTVAVKSVGLAADAAIGVVKISGRAVAAVLPGGD